MEQGQLFAQLILQLSSSDNAARSAAEQQYTTIKGDPIGRIALPLNLLHVLGDASLSAPIRQLSAVLLRRLLVEEETSYYRILDSNAQGILKEGLLATLSKETDATLRARICDIVGELAGTILEPSDWPEIMSYSQGAIQSPNAQDRETGLALLGMLAHSNRAFLSVPANSAAIVAIFQKCLLDTANEGRVLLSAARALSEILSVMPQESDLDHFQGAVGPVVGGLTLAVESFFAGVFPETVPIAYTETLIEISEECSSFFFAHILDVFNHLMDILERPALPQSLKHMLVEVLVTLCNSSPKKIRKMKSASGEKGYFASRLFPFCAQLMCLLRENPKWVASSKTEEEDDECYDDGMKDSDVGETALDRMAQSLGLRSTFGTISVQLASLLSSGIWQQQRAGLRIMGNYLEVSVRIADRSQLTQHRVDVVGTLANFARSNHPQVRAAAFYSMSQLFVMHRTDISEDLLLQLAHVLLEGSSLAVNPAPRVRRNVLLAITNLIDAAPTGFLEKITEQLLVCITSALREGPVIVQECCVSAIISIAECVKGAQLAAYYDNVMPILKQLLTHARNEDLEALWGQGIECCAMVGESSGKDKFYDDAKEMMQSLIALHGELDEESDMRKYMMKAWVRIARCFGPEFLPYLEPVMATLLTAITQNVSAGTGDIDLDNLEEMEERSDVQLIECEDGGWIAVRTAAVEEQATACQLVVLLVEKLQEHFYPFVETTIRAMAPLLSSPHEDVRSYCMVAMPEFVRATGKATLPDRAPIVAVSEFILGQLLTSIEKENTLELIMTGLQALKLVLNYASQDWASWAAQAAVKSRLAPNITPSSPKGGIGAALAAATGPVADAAVAAAANSIAMAEPPAPTPDKSIRFLNTEQMIAITNCAKIVLRDSLQRRAVMRAEAHVSGGHDEEDVADEHILMEESLELHYNVGELVGAALRTHGDVFLSVYQQNWHEMITEMMHPHCLQEDRTFAFFVISDVIEFGLNATTAAAYLSAVVPTLCEACSSVVPAGPRQVCAYALGKAAEMFPHSFAPFAGSALQALAASISRGEEEGEPRGAATDNAVAAAGRILEHVEALGTQGINYEFWWRQWLDYLPLRHDKEENGKVLVQLARLLVQRRDSLVAKGAQLPKAIAVLVNAFDAADGNDTSPEVSLEIARSLERLHAAGGDLTQSIAVQLGPELAEKLQRVLGADMSQSFLSFSPLATAPIHDVLLRR